MVQQLRHFASTARGAGSIPGWDGTRIPPAEQPKEKKKKKKALTEAHVTGEETEAGVPNGSAVGGGSYPDPGSLSGGFLPKSTWA